MKIQPGYLLSFLAFLVLSGFCDCFPVSVSNGDYLKQSEWVTRDVRKINSAKIYYFQFTGKKICSIRDAGSRPRDSNELYNQRILLNLLSQVKLFVNRIIINILPARYYFPRLSIDDHIISLKRDRLISVLFQPGNIMCNHSKGVWINQERDSYRIGSRSLNVFFNLYL